MKIFLSFNKKKKNKKKYFNVSLFFSYKFNFWNLLLTFLFISKYFQDYINLFSYCCWIWIVFTQQFFNFWSQIKQVRLAGLSTRGHIPGALEPVLGAKQINRHVLKERFLEIGQKISIMKIRFF